jgi:hypothetical protein
MGMAHHASRAIQVCVHAACTSVNTQQHAAPFRRLQDESTMVHVVWQLRNGAEPSGEAVEDQIVFPEECSLTSPSMHTIWHGPAYGTMLHGHDNMCCMAKHAAWHARCTPSIQQHGPTRLPLHPQIPSQPRCYELHFPNDASRSLFFWWVAWASWLQPERLLHAAACVRTVAAAMCWMCASMLRVQTQNTLHTVHPCKPTLLSIHVQATGG